MARGDRVTRRWIASQLSGGGATLGELVAWAQDYDPALRETAAHVWRALVWLESEGFALFHRGRWHATERGRNWLTQEKGPANAA